MTKYHRTTITIPEQTYKKVKKQAMQNKQSLSGYVTNVLQKVNQEPEQAKPLPLGKYHLGSRAVARRKIYDSYFRNKISR